MLKMKSTHYCFRHLQCSLEYMLSELLIVWFVLSFLFAMFLWRPSVLMLYELVTLPDQMS